MAGPLKKNFFAAFLMVCGIDSKDKRYKYWLQGLRGRREKEVDRPTVTLPLRSSHLRRGFYRIADPDSSILWIWIRIRFFSASNPDPVNPDRFGRKRFKFLFPSFSHLHRGWSQLYFVGLEPDTILFKVGSGSDQSQRIFIKLSFQLRRKMQVQH